MELRNSAGKKSIITKSYAGNEGKIVTCIRLATEDEMYSAGRFVMDESEPYWVIDRELKATDGTSWSFAADFQMTPLQDLDEPEQQVQDLYAPGTKSKKVVDKNRMYNYTPDF